MPILIIIIIITIIIASTAAVDAQHLKVEVVD